MFEEFSVAVVAVEVWTELPFDVVGVMDVVDAWPLGLLVMFGLLDLRFVPKPRFRNREVIKSVFLIVR